MPQETSDQPGGAYELATVTSGLYRVPGSHIGQASPWRNWMGKALIGCGIGCGMCSRMWFKALRFKLNCNQLKFSCWMEGGRGRERERERAETGQFLLIQLGKAKFAITSADLFEARCCTCQLKELA